MCVLIVDDEVPARQRLASLLRELAPDYELLGEAKNGQEAVDFCQHHEVDVVLMDIHMPGMDGLNAAALISKQPLPPAVIFTTAYSEHALSAFDVNAADYLLKPIRLEKLQHALQKASRLTKLQVNKVEPEEIQYLVAKYRGGIQRIPVDDIYYFHADNKYVVARHKDGELLLEEPLKSLEQRFKDRFLRIHRNALVAIGKLSGLDKDASGVLRVKFSDLDETLEVSRRHQAAIRSLLDQSSVK